MKKLPSCLTVIILGIILELYVTMSKIPSYILPKPSIVLKDFVMDYENILKHSYVTFSEALIGLLISLVIAIIVGLLMDTSKTLKACLLPILTVTQTVPVIVLTPLLVVYFGFGLLPKIIVIVLMCFFPICINFSKSLEKSDKTYAELIKSFGGTRWQVQKIAKIPASMPEIFAGLKIGATYSVTGAVVGEWIGAKEGLGYYLIRLNNSFLVSKVFAVVVAIVILSFIMQGIVSILEKRFCKG